MNKLNKQQKLASDCLLFSSPADPLTRSPDCCDVAVIGGGAAGLLAGIAAARGGARTRVYERMAEAGRKIALSGGGRCNFTNTLNPRDFVRRFGDKNAAFLGHALRAFSRDDLIALLASHGIAGQIERAYRVYTKSGRGGDVVNALAAELQKAGGVLLTDARILNVRRLVPLAAAVCSQCLGDTALAEPQTAAAQPVAPNSGGREARDTYWLDTAGSTYSARAVIICTGGLSYPATGSTGDGFTWARALGHEVTALRAALVGLTVEENWTRELQGLACPDVEVSLYPYPSRDRKGADKPLAYARGSEKALGVERGEILFTHFGVSGPAILDISNTFVAAQASRQAGGMSLNAKGGPPQAKRGVGERSEQEASNKTQPVLEMPRFGRGFLWPSATPPVGRGHPVTKGHSAPCTTQASRALLTIDFFPALRREMIEQRVRAHFKQHPKRSLAHALQGMLPPRLLEHFADALGADSHTPVNQLPGGTREKLLDLFKATRLTVTGTRGVEHGEVTAGGVSWDQIDPATLESKLFPGLFFAGEILDVAGRCGGFNLQAAFSTGYLAGQSAARRVRLGLGDFGGCQERASFLA